MNYVWVDELSVYNHNILGCFLARSQSLSTSLEKFQGCYVILGPEMRITGEVMSISSEFLSVCNGSDCCRAKLHLTGSVFICLNDMTKSHLEKITVSFIELGFKIIDTSGTAHLLELKGISVEVESAEVA